MAPLALHPRQAEADNDNDVAGPRATHPLSARARLRPSAWSRMNLSPDTTVAIALSGSQSLAASQSLRNSPGETSKMRET